MAGIYFAPCLRHKCQIQLVVLAARNHAAPAFSHGPQVSPAENETIVTFLKISLAKLANLRFIEHKA